MASQKLPLLLLLLCLVAVAESAQTVTLTWDFGKFVSVISISIGDSVLFSYPPSTHSVLAIYDETNYNDCNTGASSATYSTGQDLITFYKPGTSFFICGFAGHCNSGMKVKVIVS